MFSATIGGAFVRSPEEISLHTEAGGSAPPDAFGPFRVLHQIGAGALGPVFRAYDPEQDKLVAVKLFRLDLPPERVHQLVASLERLIAADLTHSAIAAPLATGIVQASAFLAQDFVAADSLDTVVREHGPAPAGEALRIITQLAGALDFAAVVGIVHGALHPRDVLICPDDVRLTGLGVARALESAGAQAPVRRPYAAPERVAGTSADRRADVYSLATLAHELLWGRRIAAIGTDGSSSLADLPGARMDALRAAFSRALAEDPASRFATALDFAEALRDSLSQQSAVDSQQSAVDRRLSTDDRGLSTADRRLSTVAPQLPLDVDEMRAKPDDAVPPSRVNVQPLAPIEPPAPPVQEKEPAHPAVGRAEEPVRREPADDLVLRRGEETRFDEVEIASAIVGPKGPVPSAALDAGSDDRLLHRAPAPDSVHAVHSVEPVHPATPEPLVKPGRTPTLAHPEILANLPHPANLAHHANDGNLDRSRSAVWPLSLALIVGVALGFAGGYWLGQSERQDGVGVASSANATAGPETEVPIKPDPAPARTAEVPPMSAAPPAAVPSAVEPSAAPRTPPPADAAKPRPEPAAVARTGRITVRTTPAGARVLVDGRDVGKTPLTIPNLARGTHTVRVMRDGYTSLDRRVSITAGEPTATLSLNLTRTPTPAARGASPPPAAQAKAARDQTSLLVESRPTGATVFLDGKRVGTTPMSLPAVTSGNHAVRLELTGFKPWTASVRVVAGERNRVAASLEQ